MEGTGENIGVLECRRPRGLAECRGVSAIWSSANPRGSSSGSIVGFDFGMGGRRAARRVRVRRGPDALRVPRRHLHAPLGPMGPRPGGRVRSVRGADRRRRLVRSFRGLDRRRVAIRPRGVRRLPRRVVPDGPATETSPRSRRVARSVSHIRARVRRRRGSPRRARLLRRSRRRRGGAQRGGLLSRRPGRRGRAPNPYLGAGNAVLAACGRISYTFGFRGASLAIDTACRLRRRARRAHAVVGPGSGSGSGPRRSHRRRRRRAPFRARAARHEHIRRRGNARRMADKTLDADADGYVRTEAVWAMPLWSTTVGGARSARRRR